MFQTASINITIINDALCEVQATDSSTRRGTSASPSMAAAALNKASPLRPSRRLLKRASSTGHDIANHPSLPKRRRITCKSAPRIEFTPPLQNALTHVPHTSTSSVHPTPSFSDKALSQDDPKPLLPEVDEDDPDTLV